MTQEEWDRIEEEIDRDMHVGPNPGCYECGGRGWVVRCIDDLCHGQDECIHGDPPSPCYTCNSKGLYPDEL